MRVALFIIIVFLGQLMHELTLMPGILIDILCVIGAWRLIDNYLEYKKGRIK